MNRGNDLRRPLVTATFWIFAALAPRLATPAAAADDVMRVHLIDVGQGAATLVEFPCGTVLIDTGGERTPQEEWLDAKYDSTPALMAYLKKVFAQHPERNNQLDLLILTHPHRDHTRGVPKVLETFNPKSVVYNGQLTTDWQVEARDYAKETPGVRSWYVLERTINADTGLSNPAIDPLTSASCQPTDPQIRALWGQVKDDSGWDNQDFDDENNHSVVIRIDFGDASILFPGDLEETTVSANGGEKPKAGIERLLEKYKGSNLLDVDVYHVGHHGSHNGTTAEFLAAMSPEMAVIAAGPPCKRSGYTAWQHGHPREVTFNDLETAVSGTRKPKIVKVFETSRKPRKRTVTKAIYSTSWDGTVVLEARPDGAWSVVKKGQQSCAQ